MATKKHIVGVALDSCLYSHLAGIAKAYSLMTGNHVSISHLVRKALIEQYKFGKIQLSSVETPQAISAAEMYAATAHRRPKLEILNN